MDFIDSAVIPQSYHHLELIRYLLILTFLIFIPYLSLLVGSLFYSLRLDAKSKKNCNSALSYFSKKVIDFITPNRSLLFAFGLVPLLSTFFAYAQLLLNNSGIILSGIVFSFASFIVGIYFVYKYKSALHIKDILKFKNDISTSEKYILNEAEILQDESSKSYSGYGKSALVFLILSAVFFFGAIAESLYADKIAASSNVFVLLLNITSWMYIFFFIALSLAIGAASSVFVRKNDKSYTNDSESDSEFSGMLLKTGLISTLASFILLVFEILTLPKVALSALSFGVFILIVLVVISLLVLFYLMIRDKNYRFANSLFYLFFIFIGLVIVKNNIAFATSAEEQFFVMSKKYDEYHQNLLSSMGVAVVEIKGEDIYNGKCIACHQFDQKLVGPPYNLVLKKYEGKMDDLVKYILNPVKVDPAFPSMPNQGLKPNEAKAIAEYIVSVYQQKKQ